MLLRCVPLPAAPGTFVLPDATLEVALIGFAGSVVRLLLVQDLRRARPLDVLAVTVPALLEPFPTLLGVTASRSPTSRGRPSTKPGFVKAAISVFGEDLGVLRDLRQCAGVRIGELVPEREKVVTH